MKPQTRLRFEIGGFLADGVQIRLTRGHLVYRKTIGPVPCEPAQVTQPSEEQWRQFWQEVDRIGVWTWEAEYWNHDVLDGIQWSLSLCHAGRKMKSEGSNAYPGGSDSVECPDDGPFADLRRALAALAGQPTGILSGEPQ